VFFRPLTGRGLVFVVLLVFVFLVVLLFVLGILNLFQFFVLLRGCRLFPTGDILVEGLPDLLQILVLRVPLVLLPWTESLAPLQLGSSETKTTDNLAD